MARINLYQQRSLASSLVGTPGVDTSGLQMARDASNATIGVANSLTVANNQRQAQFANPFSGLGSALSNAMRQHSQAQQQKQALIDHAELNNLHTEMALNYNNKSAEWMQQIRTSDNPQEALKNVNKQIAEYRQSWLQDPRFSEASPGFRKGLDDLATSATMDYMRRVNEHTNSVIEGNVKNNAEALAHQVVNMPFENVDPAELMQRRSMLQSNMTALRTVSPKALVDAAYNINNEKLTSAYYAKVADTNGEEVALQMLEADKESQTALGSNGVDRIKSRINDVQANRMKRLKDETVTYGLQQRVTVSDIENSLYADSTPEAAFKAVDSISTMIHEADVKASAMPPNSDAHRQALKVSEDLRDARIRAQRELQRRKETQKTEEEKARKDAEAQAELSRNYNVESWEAWIPTHPDAVISQAQKRRVEYMNEVATGVKPPDPAYLNKLNNVIKAATTSRDNAIVAKQKQAKLRNIQRYETPENDALRADLSNDMIRLKDALKDTRGNKADVYSIATKMMNTWRAGLDSGAFINEYGNPVDVYQKQMQAAQRALTTGDVQGLARFFSSDAQPGSGLKYFVDNGVRSGSIPKRAADKLYRDYSGFWVELNDNNEKLPKNERRSKQQLKEQLDGMFMRMVVNYAGKKKN